jgi:hypothetical protein
MAKTKTDFLEKQGFKYRYGTNSCDIPASFFLNWFNFPPLKFFYVCNREG